MKLIRYGAVGLEEPGVAISDGRRIDAGGEVDDYDERFFAAGGLGLLSKWVSAGCPGGREVDPLVRLGPPVARPSKIVCIGQLFRPRHGNGWRNSGGAYRFYESQQCLEWP